MRVSTVESGQQGFWRPGPDRYIQWMMVNFCDLFFLDFWLIQRKAESRFIILVRRGIPAMSSSLDEGLCFAGASASVATPAVPYPGGGPRQGWAAH